MGKWRKLLPFLSAVWLTERKPVLRGSKHGNNIWKVTIAVDFCACADEVHVKPFNLSQKTDICQDFSHLKTKITEQFIAFCKASRLFTHFVFPFGETMVILCIFAKPDQGHLWSRKLSFNHMSPEYLCAYLEIVRNNLAAMWEADTWNICHVILYTAMSPKNNELNELLKSEIHDKEAVKR